MKLFNFKYGPELERTVSIDLDCIIFIRRAVKPRPKEREREALRRVG